MRLGCYVKRKWEYKHSRGFSFTEKVFFLCIRHMFLRASLVKIPCVCCAHLSHSSVRDGCGHFHRLTSSHFNRRHIVDFRAAGWKTTKACFVHASPLELYTWIDMFYFTWSRTMHQDKKFPMVKLFWLHVTLGIQDFKIRPLGDFETEHFVSGTGDENPS